MTEVELETRAAHYESKPQKSQDRAQRHLRMVLSYQALRERGIAHGTACRSVCDEFGIKKGALNSYRKLIRGQPRHAWLYLLDDHYPGRTKCAPLSAAAFEVLKADYLRLERPTKAACIDRLIRAAPEHGWVLPSRKTLERRLDEIPSAVRMLARHGAKAASQYSYPPQQRSREALTALQIINGDGYKHNIWVLFPDGEIIRAKTWFWQDVYSSKILGWRTDKTEHTDLIRLSYGDLVERYGIPDAVLLDNTLAAANKTMSGGVKHRFRFKVKDEEPLGVFPLMGSEVHFAKVEHGQGKPVERTFGIGGVGEMVDKAPDFAGAWTGANTLDKPDYDKKHRAIPVAELTAVIEREIAAWNAKPGRHGAIHALRSCDEVFETSYAKTIVRRPTEAQRRLWLLATEPVRANSRDGSITLDAGRAARTDISPTQANRYWAAPLNDYAGQMVAARFDPQRLHEGLHVYTLDGRYICFADCHVAAGFNDADAGREHNRARAAHVRATKQQLAAEVRMDAIQASKFIPGAERNAGSLTIPSQKVVRGEFRDPLERPVPQPTPMSDEERAQHQAELLEFNRPAPRKAVALDDPEANYRRWLAVGERIAAGAQVDDCERAWHASYKNSDEWRAMQLVWPDIVALERSHAIAV